MAQRTDWKALSDHINGFSEALKFYLTLIKERDVYGIAKKELLPHFYAIWHQVKDFSNSYRSILSPQVDDCINRFLSNTRPHISKDAQIDPVQRLQFISTYLISFQAELNYHFQDYTTTAKRLTERAFIHLQRSIIADENIKNKWVKAFEAGELLCEKLGGAHLLSHGIWGFKASAEGERTDLVLGEPLKDFSQMESTSEALVLTEWKVVRKPNEFENLANKALKQAKRYSEGILAGFELSYYRYLVFVSEMNLKLPSDERIDDIIYRHVNVAVNPKSPSKS